MFQPDQDLPVSSALDDVELSYHQHLLGQLRIAADVQAAFRQWEVYLATRYGLKPGDEIKQDGTFVRKS